MQGMFHCENFYILEPCWNYFLITAYKPVELVSYSYHANTKSA